jgi:hypothetical protein
MPPQAVHRGSPSTPVRVEKKVGRNDPCPCGSGKKFKQCHGKDAVPEYHEKPKADLTGRLSSLMVYLVWF